MNQEKRIDYKQLNDPFPTDLDDDLLLMTNIINAIIMGDELTSLNEAKRLADWPKWKKAMQAKLNQLKQMGTWELIDKPPDAVPILNKWVFIQKRNKIGQIIKYKARLVARGYSQRLGQDYDESYSPVIRVP